MSRSLPLFASARSIALLSAIAGPMTLACLQNQPSGGIELHSSALTTTLGLSADATVRSGTHAGANYGTTATLLSDSDDGGSVDNSYLRFSIGSVGTISSAKLRFYVSDASGGPHDVKQVSNLTWGETTITWNNKPAVDGPLVGTIPSAAKNTWIEVDITSIAQPNTTLSLAILPGTNDGLDLRSRNDATNPPQVVITSSGGGTRRHRRRGHRRHGRRGHRRRGRRGHWRRGRRDLDRSQPEDRVRRRHRRWRQLHGRSLNLALAEGAQAIVTAGDMTYDADPTGWWTRHRGARGAELPGVPRARQPRRHLVDRLPAQGREPPRRRDPRRRAARRRLQDASSTASIIATIKKGDTGATINASSAATTTRLEGLQLAPEPEQDAGRRQGRRDGLGGVRDLPAARAPSSSPATSTATTARRP